MINDYFIDILHINLKASFGHNQFDLVVSTHFPKVFEEDLFDLLGRVPEAKHGFSFWLREPFLQGPHMLNSGLDVHINTQRVVVLADLVLFPGEGEEVPGCYLG